MSIAVPPARPEHREPLAVAVAEASEGFAALEVGGEARHPDLPVDALMGCGHFQESLLGRPPARGKETTSSSRIAQLRMAAALATARQQTPWATAIRDDTS